MLTASLIVLGLSTTLAAFAAGPALQSVMVELTAFVALCTLGLAFTAGRDAVDRTARVAVLVVAGMVLAGFGLSWQRGEQISPVGGILGGLTRFGLAAFLVAWTSLVSQVRHPAQYLYNIVFVSAFAFLIGYATCRVTLGDSPGSPGWLVAFLQGASAGSALSYVTLGFPGTSESGGQAS